MAGTVLSQVALPDFIQPDNSRDQMLPDLAEGSLPNTACASSHIVEIFQHDDGPIPVEPTVELDPGSGQNPEKSMKWLRKTGIVTTLSATSAMLSRAPGGLFSHQEKVYLIILIIILMMGLIEVFAASWIARSRFAHVITWLAVVPFVLVTGVGGSTVLAI